MTDVNRVLTMGVVICVASLCGCGHPAGTTNTVAPGSFGDDVAFLKQHTDAFVLESPDSQGRVAVVPGMQARVMTSTTGGDAGASFGWINRDLIRDGGCQPHINVFGGEDRFWLGPEGGQYSIFFKQGDPFDLAHWQTPAAIDWGGYELVSRAADRAHFASTFVLTNYSGAVFDLKVDRTVRVYGNSDIAGLFGVTPGDGVQMVGYETENRITNTGENAWTKERGLLSVWILGMFKHSPKTTVVIPFVPGDEAELGPIVNDAYFGKVPADRLAVKEEGVLFFKADGQYRSKIGIPPRRAKDVMGSYNADDGVLTLVKFTLPEGVTDYVNSMWELQEKPYGGDVANSYNDGPSQPGAKPLGPFYELESSSPAAALGAGESLVHVHHTVHIQGDRARLDAIAGAVLGAGLDEIESAL